MKDCDFSKPESKHSMSNFDHTIDDDMESDLRNGMIAQHAAWHFCGHVWFENHQFHEAVYRYNSHVDTKSAASLENLMNDVNDEYGSG